MKTYDIDGRTFTQRMPSLAVENKWLEFALNEDGSFNRSALRDLTQDQGAVQWFMERLLSGDHDGMDWYNDAPSDVVGEVLGDFFTRWSERTIKALDMLSDGSEEKSSSQSAAQPAKRKKTA